MTIVSGLSNNSRQLYIVIYTNFDNKCSLLIQTFNWPATNYLTTFTNHHCVIEPALTDEEITTFLLQFKTKIRYMSSFREFGDINHYNFHFHIYLETYVSASNSTIIRWFAAVTVSNCHYEICFAGRDKNESYMKKQGTFVINRGKEINPENRMLHLLSLPLSEAVSEDTSFFQRHATNFFTTLRHLPQPRTRLHDEKNIQKGLLLLWRYRL
jgi:hypothetical protein